MKNLILLFAVTFLFSIPAISQTSTTTGQRSIDVAKLQIKQGVDFPVAKLDVMTGEIVDELTKLKKFGTVNSIVGPEAAASDLIFTGTITDYTGGNRAARYLIGFGAGKAKVVAEIKIVDRATGNVLLDRKVDGKVIMGLFGGNTNGATRGLAKEVAKETKKALFK
jgi:hypothetical protein